MALVRNRASFAIDIPDGTWIEPGNTALVNEEDPHIADYIEQGLLTVEDPDAEPPDPVLHYDDVDVLRGTAQLFGVHSNTGVRTPITPGLFLEQLTVARTIWASQAGGGDGDSADSRCTIPEAIAKLQVAGMILEGSWILDLDDSADFGGFTLPARTFARETLVIRGADVGGHPNVPTTRIKRSVDTTKSRGINIEANNRVRIVDIRTEGYTRAGITAQDDCEITYWNHHDEASVTGRQHFSGVHHNHAGGILRPTLFGVEEAFGCVRDCKGTVVSYAEEMTGDDFDDDTDWLTLLEWGTVIDGTLAGGPVSGGDGRGWYAKENCTGHFDFTTIKHFETGVSMPYASDGNTRFLQILNCYYGIATRNAGTHQESDVIWGEEEFVPGVINENAGCKHRLKELGFGGGVDQFGSGNTASRLGLRPLLVGYLNLAESYTDDVTTEQEVLTYTVPAWLMTLRGKHIRLDLWGTITEASGSGNILLRVELGEQILLNSSIDISAIPNFTDLQLDCDVVKSSTDDDPDEAHARTKLFVDGMTPDVSHVTWSFDPRVDNDLVVTVQLPNTQNVFKRCDAEVYI